MKRKKKAGGVDRISELPEFIIHQILSHLSTKDAIRTSVLSKTWYAFKASYPVLDFNQKHYNKEPVSKFRNAVNNSLHHLNRNELELQALSVHIYSPMAWSELYGQTKKTSCFYLYDQAKKVLFSDLDSWLRLALENGVKNLDLDAATQFYTLPQPYSFSKTLTILNLNRCHLDQPLSLFSSLRKLGLKNCRIDCPMILKEGDCPLLEDFVFYDCCGFKAVVSISDLPQLRTVEFSVGRYAPIDELVVSCQSIQNFTIRDVAPLSVINIVGCNHLKILQLQSANMNGTQFHHLLSKLPLLEELYVFHCYSLQVIKISNPRLKTLVVSLVRQDSLKIVEIATPSLKSFIFASDLFKPNRCRIKVANCCSSLETLVLFKYFATERTIHSLISKFPLLENLWIIGFPNLQSISIPNPQLMRLHLVRCLKLKAVNVASPNLCEFCYTGSEPPKFSVADMEASGGLSFEEEASRLWLKTFKDMLKNIGIKDYLLTYLIVSFVNEPLY